MDDNHRMIKNSETILDLLKVTCTCWNCRSIDTDLYLNMFLYYYDQRGYRQHYGPVVHCAACQSVMVHQGNTITLIDDSYNLDISWDDVNHIGKVRTVLNVVNGKADIMTRKHKRSTPKKKKEYRHRAIILA